MALIKCPECDKEVSDKALTCPHCGRPLLFLRRKRTNTNISTNAHNEQKHYLKLILCILLLPTLSILAMGVYDNVYTTDMIYAYIICSLPLIPSSVIRFCLLKRQIKYSPWPLSLLINVLTYGCILMYLDMSPAEIISNGYSHAWVILFLVSLINTNGVLLAGSGRFLKSAPLLDSPHKEEVLSVNLEAPMTELTEEVTSPSSPKISAIKENFFRSCLWKDLRFPLLWVPVLSAVINALLFIFFPITGTYWSHSIDITTVLLLSIFGSIATNAAYLAPPLILRFLVFKQPMKSMTIKTLMATFLLGMMVKLVLIATGQSFGRSAVVPILQEIAIYYVLTAGANAEQFIYKKPK